MLILKVDCVIPYEKGDKIASLFFKYTIWGNDENEKE